MIETAAMIVAVYVGYTAGPWWFAATLGAAAGLWNLMIKIRTHPHVRETYASANWSSISAGLSYIIVASAGLFVLIYGAGRVVAHLVGR